MPDWLWRLTILVLLGAFVITSYLNSSNGRYRPLGIGRGVEVILDTRTGCVFDEWGYRSPTSGTLQKGCPQ